MKKTISLVLALLFAAAVFASCGPVPTDKEFSDFGITMTLDSTFKQDKLENWDLYFWSGIRDIHIYCLKETFSLMRSRGMPEITLENYVEFNVESYEVSADSVVYEADYAYFEYDDVLERVESGRKINYSILVAMYKCDGAFWTIEFCCRKPDYPEYGGMLKKFAGAVKFYDYKAPPKVFSEGGFEITLTDEFERYDPSDGYVAEIYSDDISVVVSKDAKTGDLADMSIDEYIEYALGETESTTSYNGLNYVEFWWEGNRGNYSEMFFVFETENEFWAVEFVADYDDYERLADKMIQYALSVKIK